MSAPDVPEAGIAPMSRNARAKRRDSDSGSGLGEGLNMDSRAIAVEKYIIGTQANETTRIKKMLAIL